MRTEAPVRIRTLDPNAPREIELVAQRMRSTLVEVLGEERGKGLYSHEQLEHRVRQHLDPDELTGQVYLAETSENTIVGHAIVRLDDDGHGNPIGLFSTVFVTPEYRRHGVATALLMRGEQWMLEHRMAQAVTYTDKHNVKLQRLFAAHEYTLRPMPRDFVALSKSLALPAAPQVEP